MVSTDHVHLTIVHLYQMLSLNLNDRTFNHDHFSFIQVNYGSKTHASAAHLHMLQESHMIVRNAFIGQQAKNEHLLDLYKESCGLLGEYYSQ